jgi:hypothetical protein
MREERRKRRLVNYITQAAAPLAQLGNALRRGPATNVASQPIHRPQIPSQPENDK